MARKIQAKKILMLRANGLSMDQIVTKGMSKSSVKEVFDRADAKYITYSDVSDMSEDDVYKLIFPDRNNHTSVYEQPDYDEVHKQLACVGVTLKLLHAEYRDRCIASGTVYMGYNKFCVGYRRFTVSQNITSRVGHKPGRIVEVDWSGSTMQIIDPLTGEIHKVYLFVATLPFSRYTYVEPTLNMKQNTWLNCHVNMFEYFGGSSACIVPDNVKTAVVKHPHKGEIKLNQAYEDLATHYLAAVLPARVKKPKDKPSVEGSVGNIATSIIAKLRNTQFFDFKTLFDEVRRCLDEFNATPFQKRQGSRESVFKTEEIQALKPLPKVPFEVCEWVYGRKVQINSHIAYKKNFYSAPCEYVKEKVDLRISAKMLEIYYKNERIATHMLLDENVANKYMTNPNHMPKDSSYSDWNIERIRNWAMRCGPNTTQVIDKIAFSVKFEQQAYNPALSVLRLTHEYGAKRLEDACRLALSAGIGCPRYRDVSAILKSGQDLESDSLQTQESNMGYVRGQNYYGGE